MTRMTLPVVCLMALSQGLSARPSTPPSQSRPLRATNIQLAAVDAVVKEEMRASHIPGVAVAVVDNGAIVLERAYGVADLEHDTPMTTNAIFEVASITKQFTAAGIMLLVEEGKIRLDDLVSTHLESTPTMWGGISIRHLLHHTSGLDISALPRLGGSRLMAISKAQAFEFISRQALFRPTGENGWYSDGGYVLLGMIIERVSGQSYRDFVTQRIFEPLGMRSSSFRDLDRVLKGRVPSYTYRDGGHYHWRHFELRSAICLWDLFDAAGSREVGQVAA